MNTLAIAIIATLALVAIAALGFAAWIIVRTHRETVALGRANAETIAKTVTLVVQTSDALSQRLERDVSRRVGVVNSLLRGQQPDAPPAPGEPIGDMPAAPIFQTGYVDDEHEIQRETSRVRRPGADPVRETGIGNTPLEPPAVRAEAL